ncbi:hypothetical protein APR50_32560 [Variovorax paradoxus]|jgi:hypothetical protein|uniref:hypothetical protein n=1 Tax=Variovorax paradoxus TaxID=34073 RepID=UPI0006E6BC94|nr:hypothetical protein APR52_14035 [Variovorax paradoxus]KPV00456.1 hypothetical protein APR50_32560 [Variovorax paradoxus]KPV08087.1 hypothetical protein APR49_16105 [Variovorax paradoxus]KPV22551.1 hypothetical protein APR51_10100 [Variovorax paradoxus]KPV35379.1 hypothetical protein APR48_04350 [Variovorax paradoxus]
MRVADIASIALGAQRRLHDLAWTETCLRQAGQLTVEVARGIADYRAADRCRLDGCAVHFASFAPANDGAFVPEPTPELA